jgi:type VI secretion system secreted protein VgrG
MNFSHLKEIKNSVSNLNPLERLSVSLPELPFPALEEMLASFASAFTQGNRLFKLQIGDGQAFGERLLPQSVEGTERLSSCYKYEVTCLSPDAFIPLGSLLGQPAQLDILTGAGGLLDFDDDAPEEVTRCGLITKARALPSDGGFAQYRLTIEPPVALLRHRTTSRVFQDMSAPQIVEQILTEHINGNSAIGSTLKLMPDLIRGHEYLPRSYCVQYRESDLGFIERLLFEEGLPYRFEHEGGEAPAVCFIVFDDPYGLPQSSQGSVRYHRAEATEEEDSLTEWTELRQLGVGRASLASFDYKPVLTNEAGEESRSAQGDEGIAAEASLEDFDAQTLYYGKDANDLARHALRRQESHDWGKGGYMAQGNFRQLQAGEWFALTGHPYFDKYDNQKEREFVACAVKFSAHNNLPGGLAKHLKAQPAPEPPPYWVEIEARKRGLPLVPAYAHTRHAKPTAPGIQTATVTGPAGEEVHTDEMGRVKIQFHWQRPKEHPEYGANFDERSSCWVRVAYPGAGGAWGHQSLPRLGQEVVVDFIEGDIDRPLVTGVIHNGRQANPMFSGMGRLPANRALTGIKTKEHHGQQYGELLFDDTTGQVRTRLSSEHGKTQLNQGFLTHPRQDGAADPRGEGFELRTDRSGAVRAAEGLLLSAHARPNASGRQLDRAEALAVLEMALSIAQEQGKASSTHHADETGTVEQERLLRDARQWEDGSNTGKDSPVKSNKAIIAAAAPDGIALASEANVTLAAGSSVDSISAQDSSLTAGRNFRARAGEAVSLFARKMGMKLIAAAGKVQVQAQDGEMEVGAAKRLHLYSLEEILIEAPKVTIRGQNGGVEYADGILSRTTGADTRHAGAHGMGGPASASASPPGMPQGAAATNERYVLSDRFGKAIEQVQYEIRDDQGRVKDAGSTDSDGTASKVSGKAVEAIKMFLK